MDDNRKNRMYQVSVLQALLLGYTRGVVTVEELVGRGSIGLGTFENANGEMIVLDGQVYRADSCGNAMPADLDERVPFASIAEIAEEKTFDIADIDSLEQLKQVLTNAIEEDFGLNSMYVVRIDGRYSRILARSEEGQRSQHIPLSEILQKNQKDFTFDGISGTLVCLYYPDYMDGINAAGWHMHFISDDRRCGGHVFDLKLEEGRAGRSKIDQIEIRIPSEAAFDTYSLKSVSAEEVKKVEQSSGETTGGSES